MIINAISFKGMPSNYSKIDNTLSRSAQPMADDFAWLKEQGITDIVNFRTMVVSGVEFDEKTAVESLGMKYHNIPSITSKPEEKNILTGLVRRTDSNYKIFMDHDAKSYVMEKIPKINLMDIRYFLPMVGGSIDGYYEVERIGFTTVDNNPALRLRLGRYINIGDNMVEIYKKKMQPGELISYEYTLKMYNNEI
jgi:hypothetical protein